jgi:hypothetical protein
VDEDAGVGRGSGKEARSDDTEREAETTHYSILKNARDLRRIRRENSEMPAGL